LCEAGALKEPILYLSLFFKTHRQLYYDLLNRVRTKGDWEAWIEFFLEGIKETSEQAVAAARRILNLLEADRKSIATLGRPAASALKLYQFSQTNPIFSIAATAKKVGVSFPTVSAAVDHLQRLGILEEITNRRRSRLFVYRKYLDILSEGTTPLPVDGG
jgi:Fic family protein